MRKSEAFPSRFFKAEDVKERPIVLTIDRMYQDRIGPEKKDKNILAFLDTEKELVCNATNWDAIADITGSADSDDWHGHRIVLAHALVEFQGKKVPGIRVISPDELSRQQRTKIPTSKPTEPPVTGHLDEEPPFDDYRV
jgi:hypothetical protein